MKNEENSNKKKPEKKKTSVIFKFKKINLFNKCHITLMKSSTQINTSMTFMNIGMYCFPRTFLKKSKKVD